MRFASLLAHRRIFSIAVGAGMLLALATLTVGFVLDDYGFVLWLDGTGLRRTTPFNLYEFARADRIANFDMVRIGPWPWWADLDLKVRFFRPLSSALLWVDHALFGHAPLGYHLHSLVWYGLLLVVVGLVLRAALSPRVFALAFVLYAVSGAHAQPVGWISSRHMLIGCVPALAGFLAHLYYRERGFGPGRWLGVLGLTIGLVGSEAALGAVLYWLAYEMLGSRDAAVSWRARLRRSALPIVVGVTYYGAYRAAGYGAAHSDAYFEPSADPMRFAAAAAARVPLLLGELLGGASAEMAMVTSVAPFVVAGILTVLSFAALLRAIWPTLEENDRRALRWLGTGAVLAIVVSVGGYPGARLLLLPKLGGCALVAAVILQIGQKLVEPTLRRAARVGLRLGRGFLVLYHLVLSPLMFLGAVGMLHKMGESEDIDRTLDPLLGSAEPPNGKPARVFLLASSDPVASLYVGAAREMRAPQTVSSWVTLSMARATHHIERTGDRTLVISADPGMLHGTFENVFRGSDRAIRRGDRFELDDITVTVLAVQDRFPTSFEVVFRAISLEDPVLQLFMWRDERLVPVHLARGESITVPWTPGPTGFF